MKRRDFVKTTLASTVTSLSLAGCGKPSGPSLVIYTALDRPFSEPILKQFQETTGINVVPVFDTESTKTVGLAERLKREKSRPRADIFWNNEILHTLRLENEGVFAEYASPAGNDFPANTRSAKNRWFGLAARARVLLVHPKKAGQTPIPKSLDQLIQPAYKGKVAMAKPLFGTTATYMTVLYRELGAEPFTKWLVALKNNGVQILSGNKQVAVAVGKGEFAFGLTDTDDALAELQAHQPVTMYARGFDAKRQGAMLIPNTVGVIKGGPNPQSARRFIDFVLSAQVEKKLAQGKSGQWPLNPKVKARPDWPSPEPFETRVPNFADAVDDWPAAAKLLTKHFASA